MTSRMQMQIKQRTRKCGRKATKQFRKVVRRITSAFVNGRGHGASSINATMQELVGKHNRTDNLTGSKTHELIVSHNSAMGDKGI